MTRSGRGGTRPNAGPPTKPPWSLGIQVRVPRWALHVLANESQPHERYGATLERLLAKLGHVPQNNYCTVCETVTDSSGWCCPECREELARGNVLLSCCSVCGKIYGDKSAEGQPGGLSHGYCEKCFK